jgi:large subunit ribosomal protein L20
MPRVKKGVNAAKRRRSILSKAKGYRFGRSTKEIEARVALTKAGAHAFAHRKDKKNDFKRLWNIKINGGLHGSELSYSKLVGALKKQGSKLNRKMLANLAEENPDSFARIIASVK